MELRVDQLDVDLVDGVYDVTVQMGDLGWSSRDRMGVYLEGELQGEISTASGEMKTETYRIEVTDGRLELRLRDLGGSNMYASIASLTVVSAP